MRRKINFLKKRSQLIKVVTSNFLKNVTIKNINFALLYFNKDIWKKQEKFIETALQYHSMLQSYFSHHRETSLSLFTMFRNFFRLPFDLCHCLIMALLFFSELKIVFLLRNLTFV